MAQVPTGATFQLYTSLQAAKTVTGITNATEGVVSATAHGYSNGDFVFITSGWGRINQRAYRVKSVTTDSFVLEGANTTNTTFYPSGAGAGFVQKALTPVQISKVLVTNTSGGEAKKVVYKYIESDVEFSINDGFTAVTRTMEIDADALGEPGYVALQTLTETQANTILRTATKSGSFTLTPCTVAMNEEVIFQDGQINRVRVDISGTNRSVRYAS
jgi:hypothetical protein